LVGPIGTGKRRVGRDVARLAMRVGREGDEWPGHAEGAVHGEAFEEVRGEAQFAVGGEDVFEDCVAFGCGEEVQGAGGLWRGVGR
jgi:hypothetical protein